MTSAYVRLALRAEGQWWVAYLAPLGTMKDAVEIARVRKDLVTDDIAELFKRIGSTIMQNVLHSIDGIEIVQLQERAAPEHEKISRNDN